MDNGSVVARRNHRRHDLDNGTLRTIMRVDEQSAAMLVQIDTGELRVIDTAYAANHLEHAYALTAHSAQGAQSRRVLECVVPEARRRVKP